ncbi:MAG: hypothetical protein BroJett040_21290 [Oligoflexia bacterium]|nr:MAG: hypothetical protein BroJett040_21290 [Oligoflexia bacterium]
MKTKTLWVENSKTLQDHSRIGQKISQTLGDRAILLLQGDLGAGKTELVKSIVQSQSGGQATSPTFALHHQYQGQRCLIDHYDLYRLENEDDLETTGFWDVFSQNKGLILIEWPERINESHLPLNWPIYLVKLTLQNVGQSTEYRKVEFSVRD